MPPGTTDKNGSNEDNAVSQTTSVGTDNLTNLQGTQPNSPEQFNQPTISPTTPAPNPKKSKTKPLLLLILVIVLVAAISFLYVHEKNKNSVKVIKVTTSSSSSAATSALPNVLLTYISNDNSNLIVTNTQQKVIAKIPMPAGKKYFNVLANNGTEVLVQAISDNSTTDSLPINYLVNASGTITKLPSTLLSGVAPASYAGKSAGSVYLGPSNNVVGVNCQNTTANTTQTCNLESININSGSESTLDTATNPSGGAGAQQPLVLLGVSSNNVAYYYHATSGTSGSVTTVFKEADITTQKIVKTITPQYDGLANAFTVLSPDSSRVAYDDGNNIDILNTTTQQNTQAAQPSQCVGDNADSTQLSWSYDSSKIGFTCSVSGYVGYLKVASSTIKSLQNAVPSSASSGSSTVSSGNYTTFSLGWTTNSLYNFLVSNEQSQTYSPTDYVANIVTNKVYQITSPAGYQLALNGIANDTLDPL
jgi:hypothetical protein